MATKKFGETKGKADSNKVDAYVMKDSENSLRLVGGILPRYVYWVKGTNNKDIPIECLAFNRELEKFDNAEKDCVQEFFPDKKCQWAYSINCIDPTDGQVRVFNLKKKLFSQIQQAAEDLGDPTDPDTGWTVVFKKVKTGPLAFNVEYNLSVLKCKPAPLTAEEKELVAKAKTIDEIYPRPTPKDIRDLCERLTTGASEEDAASEAEHEGINEI
jgi:hypothetical protein